jgi:hypothetical protein
VDGAGGIGGKAGGAAAQHVGDPGAQGFDGGGVEPVSYRRPCHVAVTCGLERVCEEGLTRRRFEPLAVKGTRRGEGRPEATSVRTVLAGHRRAIGLMESRTSPEGLLVVKS